MRLALCQRTPIPNDVEGNLNLMIDDIAANDADMYIFPELFLTGYFFDRDEVHDRIGHALDVLGSISKEKGITIVFGAPEFQGDRTYNCAYAIKSGNVIAYRKIHLPNFPPFDEKERFTPGLGPIVFESHGFRFGLSICYDIFFPELIKSCSKYGMADVNICISASPVTSRTAFERVLPARAVENTTYVAYVNNVGPMGGLEFFGGSRLLAPNGDCVATLDEPGKSVLELDRNSIENARKMRPVLEDTVFETILR